jgi:hypothetical protein
MRQPVLTEAVRHLKARGREVIVWVQDPADEPRAIEPFEALRYEVIFHSSFDGTTVSTAKVAVRIGDLVRCETEDGIGPVDAVERALRQCLYAIYPPVGDLQFASYSMKSAGTYRGPAGLVRVTIEWSESGNQWSDIGGVVRFAAGGVDGIGRRLQAATGADYRPRARAGAGRSGNVVSLNSTAVNYWT